jgi:hypothetical protein
MKLSNVILAIFFFALVACAKPQYLIATSGGGIEKAGAGACAAEFPTSHTCVGISWEKLPTETEFGSFVFTLTSEAGLLTDLSVATNGILNPKVVLWMPSMGHGSAPVTVERISTGLYRAKNVFFTMKGDWEIRFQIAGEQAVRAITL